MQLNSCTFNLLKRQSIRSTWGGWTFVWAVHRQDHMWPGKKEDTNRRKMAIVTPNTTKIPPNTTQYHQSTTKYHQTQRYITKYNQKTTCDKAKGRKLERTMVPSISPMRRRTVRRETENAEFLERWNSRIEHRRRLRMHFTVCVIWSLPLVLDPRPHNNS